MDYIFRRLALDYLPFEEREALSIYSADERQRYLETGSYEPVEETGGAAELVTPPAHEADSETVVEGAGSSALVEEGRQARLETTHDTDGSHQREVPAQRDTSGAHTSAELMEKITGTAVDSPLCFTCGTKMRPAGSCYVCEGCGSTSGCS